MVTLGYVLQEGEDMDVDWETEGYMSHDDRDSTQVSAFILFVGRPFVRCILYTSGARGQY